MFLAFPVARIGSLSKGPRAWPLGEPRAFRVAPAPHAPSSHGTADVARLRDLQGQCAGQPRRCGADGRDVMPSGQGSGGTSSTECAKTSIVAYAQICAQTISKMAAGVDDWSQVGPNARIAQKGGLWTRLRWRICYNEQ